MHSELISVEDELSQFASFSQQTIHSLSQPYGTARVVSGKRLSTMESALLRYFRQHVARTLRSDGFEPAQETAAGWRKNSGHLRVRLSF
jgi:hypothetical protein